MSYGDITKLAGISAALLIGWAIPGAVLAADDAQLPESRAIIQAFGGRLKSELVAGMSEGGPTAAIGVCKDTAPQIASELSRHSGAKVSRTSLRFRNPANAPEPWQAEVLARFETQAANADAGAPLEYFEQVPDGTTRYMKAIRTGAACLACHGSALSDDIRAALDEQYPFDRARGYQEGDIRGAFSVTWPASVEKTSAITSADFSEPRTWGAMKNVVGVKHLYMSGQPDEAALREAREHGVAAVINLREPDELDWDEEAAVNALGIGYYNIPIVSGDSGLDAGAVAAITRLVGQYKGQKILLHCSSGNRVSAWLAVHLVQDHGMTADSAIELAKHANMTKPETETMVREFLGEHKDTDT